MGNATLTEALNMLEGSWASTVREIHNGNCVFWLGSGISIQKLPGVEDLIRRLLQTIYTKINQGDANCPYKEALNNIIGLTTVNGVDSSVQPSHWPEHNEVVRQLRQRYSTVLGISIRHGETVFWDILEPHNIYSDPAITPDAEHRFLALLIEEGVIKKMITTNWDTLIERAHNICRHGRSVILQSVACNDELNSTQNCGSVRLLKIHGCALKSRDNPVRYKSFLVATQSHITGWPIDAQSEPFRSECSSTFRNGVSIFVGLSGQDSNLQTISATARVGRNDFPIDPPRIIFTVDRLTLQR